VLYRVFEGSTQFPADYECSKHWFSNNASLTAGINGYFKDKDGAGEPLFSMEQPVVKWDELCHNHYTYWKP
jgi:hypothetical protein